MASSAISGLGGREECPQPNPSADPMRAHLSPQEGWVLSRVDGHTSFGELCLITGLGEDQTIQILKRLQERGLILTKNGRAQPGRSPSGPPRGSVRPLTTPVSSPGKPPSTSASVSPEVRPPRR